MALHVSREFDTPIEQFHDDPTHLIFHGAYEASQARGALRTDAGEVRSDGRLAAAHITAGRPMSDAPKDVRWIHAGLCTIVDAWGPLPIFGHTVSGNDNGHTAVAEQRALLRKHLRPPELTMISDRGTFSVGHLLRLKDAGYHAIAAAPWDEFRGLFDTQRPGLKWKQATYLSIQQQRQAAAYFRYEMLPLSENDREQLPSPKRGCRHPDHRFQFTLDQAASERDAAYDGYSAMVATTPWQRLGFDPPAQILFRQLPRAP